MWKSCWILLSLLHAGSQDMMALHLWRLMAVHARILLSYPLCWAKSRQIRNQFSSLPTCQQISYIQFGSCLALTAADPKGATRRWEQPLSGL